MNDDIPRRLEFVCVSLRGGAHIGSVVGPLTVGRSWTYIWNRKVNKESGDSVRISVETGIGSEPLVLQ